MTLTHARLAVMVEPSTVAPGIYVIDTGMAGQRELNAVYVVGFDEPALVEAAPEADGDAVLAGLHELGIGPGDLAHIIVTHIHMDHAGGAGRLLERFPTATLWVHARGAPHLIDPERLIASTARTYGWERMRALYGTMTPCPAHRVRSIDDGDRITLGSRTLDVIHTPGHASHHVALLDDASGALFTGEAIGSYLPWASCFRPALPPPEVDLEAAFDSIARMRERCPTTLLTSHFGPTPDPDAAFDRAEARVRGWADAVRNRLELEPDVAEDDLVTDLTDLARREFEDDAGRPFEPERYDAIGSIRMNAQGLARYWRNRWEREASD